VKIFSLIFNIANLLFKVFGERIAAQGGIVGVVNSVGLKKPFEFRRLDAENRRRLCVSKTRRVRPAAAAIDEIRFAVRTRSDNRQAVRFNRDFSSTFVVHLMIFQLTIDAARFCELNSVIRLICFDSRTEGIAAETTADSSAIFLSPSG
jgi:hypothetical protein